MNWRRDVRSRHSSAGAAEAEAPSTDLLADQEAAEFVRVAAERRARAEQRAITVGPPADEDSEIVWNEQEDVYRPAPVDAVACVHSLSPGSPPDVVPGESLVFLRATAYAQMLQHLKSDTTIELGGLLLG